MVSRAIHLELVTDLTAESFLQALRCLSWMKGAPRVIRSDTASNFTKSSKLLKELNESNIVPRVILSDSAPNLNKSNSIMKEMSESETIQRELVTQGVKWIFTPAYAPHFGAVYERLVVCP